MDVHELYRKFIKGVDYFHRKWAAGQDTPPIRAQLAQFEREVITPFDKECSKLSTKERRELEDQI